MARAGVHPLPTQPRPAGPKPPRSGSGPGTPPTWMDPAGSAAPGGDLAAAAARVPAAPAGGAVGAHPELPAPEPRLVLLHSAGDGEPPDASLDPPRLTVPPMHGAHDQSVAGRLPHQPLKSGPGRMHASASPQTLGPAFPLPPRLTGVQDLGLLVAKPPPPPLSWHWVGTRLQLLHMALDFHFPHMCAPKLGQPSSALGIGKTAWFPGQFHHLLLPAAAGSEASRLWSLRFHCPRHGLQAHSWIHPCERGSKLRAGYLSLGVNLLGT